MPAAGRSCARVPSQSVCVGIVLRIGRGKLTGSYNARDAFCADPAPAAAIPPANKKARKHQLAGFEMVPATGIELVTYALRVRCSTN